MGEQKDVALRSHHGNTKRILHFTWISRLQHRHQKRHVWRAFPSKARAQQHQNTTPGHAFPQHQYEQNTSQKIAHSAFPHSGMSIEDERRTKGYQRREQKENHNPTQIISNYQIIKLSIPPSKNLAAERQIYILLHFPLCLGSSLVYTYVPSKICSSVACNFRDSLRLPIWACGWRLENFNCIFNLRISRVVSRYLKLHIHRTYNKFSAGSTLKVWIFPRQVTS